MAAVISSDGSAHTKKDIRQAVMKILRRAWAKYQQLLITHPWKTQTIGTGIVINESLETQLGQFVYC